MGEHIFTGIYEKYMYVFARLKILSPIIIPRIRANTRTSTVPFHRCVPTRRN